MASVIESFEDVARDNFSFFKVLGLSSLVYFTHYFYTTNQLQYFQIMLGTTILILLSVMLCVIYNTRNGKNYILPKIFSFQILGFAMKSFVGILPIFALLGWGAYELVSFEFFSAVPPLQVMYEVVVYCLFSAVALFSMMLFGRTGNPFSSYNIVLIFKYCADAFLKIIYSLIVMALVNSIVLGLAVYVCWLFIPLDSPICIGIYSFAIVFNLIVLADCFANIEYEVVPNDEKEHII